MKQKGTRGHWWAQSFADSARNAAQAGETGRSIILYEVALNYEINAINLCRDQHPLDLPSIRDLYANAIQYAEACGRHRKAEHLTADLAALLGEASDAS